MPTPDDLRARLDELSSLDRQRFRRRIGGAAKIEDPDRRAGVLARLDGEIGDAAAAHRQRASAAPKKIAYPDDLPITERRPELLDAIAAHQVVIVAGETGSGKSTQLPKMCLELGRGVEGLIAHTQPRRLAARTIAERVAQELNTTVGGTVGFAVRFSEQTGDSTMVKLMTDGLLLAEIQRDRLLSRYDTVIVDEAHERSLNVDFLLGYLHQLLPRRPDLKVIITSATIDTERFSQHFTDLGGEPAPVVEVSGRTYPVEVRYRPLDDPDSPDPKDQPQGIAEAVRELHAETSGDILVFCAGEREIRDATDTVAALNLRHTAVLPLYARLPAAEQHRVFAPAKGRRVVIATNVAETSLTVPGVRSVIDAGTARISRYSRRTKVQRLPIEPISQASANQRAGRCGRLGPGICIRLYGEDDFDNRTEFTEPEVQRTSLASVILQMAAIGLGDVATFPFLDPPDTRSIADGINLLDELGAVDPEQEGSPNWLTARGRRLARFPLDPRFGRMVLEAHERHCLDEVLVIASALSVRDPRERPAGKEALADASHARFSVDGSDLLGWLELWRHLRTEQRARSGNRFRRMCRAEYLNYLRIREWQGVHAQLRQTAQELDLRFNRKPADPESIHRALLAGLVSHIGHKDPNSFEYRGARGARFAIQPGSVLFKASPEWVVAAELVETSRLWGRGIAAVDTAWIEEAAPHLVRRTYSDPWWDAEQGSAIATETVTLYGLALSLDRQVQFGRIDTAGARDLFIRHALLEGEWDAHHDFVDHNRRQFAEIHERESRGRAGDLLVDDEVLVAWFSERIPDDIASVRHFDRWWRDQRMETPQLLDLSAGDLLDPLSATLDDQAFPEVWLAGDLVLPITYEFDPTSPTDGVTIHIPVSMLDRVAPSMFEWQVPGFRTELIEALVRSMPKAVRKDFVPVPETVARITAGLDPSVGPLVDALRRELSKISGTPILPDVFDLDDLPNHLRPHYAVEGDDGEVMAAGPDLGVLRAELHTTTRRAAERSPHPLERSGITTWDFGELPTTVVVEGAGSPLTAYPALVDEGQAVAIRIVATPDEQAAATWDGVRRLLMLNTGLRRLRLDSNEVALAVAAGPYESETDWLADCRLAAFDAVLAKHGLAIDATHFDRLLSLARSTVSSLVEDVATVSLAVMERHRQVVAELENLTGVRFDAMVDDVVDQIGRLVYPGFVSGLDSGRLDDVVRYLDGVAHRIGRVRENLARDAEAILTVRRIESEHDRAVDSLGWTAQLVDVAWMIQEFRMSLFAQSIGVKGTVSQKRIRVALREAAM